MREIIAKLFAKSISPKIKLNPYAGASSFSTETGAINICIDDPDILGQQAFLQHIALAHKCHFVNEISPLAWTILHEIGHYFTDEQFTDNEQEADGEYRSLLALGIIPDNYSHPDHSIQEAYFNLDTEWEATEWAINYIRKHPRKCLIFGDLLR